MATNKQKTSDLQQILSDVHSYNVNLQTREIYLHGYQGTDVVDAGNEPGVEYRMSVIFVKNLRLLDDESSENILVHQQTMGGCWNHGMAVYNAIQFCKSPVTILAYAHARSMSSIFFQAADLRVLMPDTDFMIHHGETGYEGYSHGLESAASAEKRTTKRMLEIYASRCQHGEFFEGKTLNYIMGFLDKKMRHKVDWWMTPDEAISYGLADSILGEGKYKDVESIRIKRKVKWNQ